MKTKKTCFTCSCVGIQQISLQFDDYFHSFTALPVATKGGRKHMQMSYSFENK